MNTRRKWMQGAALAAAGAPMIVKASALGLGGAVAPSDKVTVANIGLGWMGFDGHVKDFSTVKSAQIVAICDIDEDHLDEAKAYIDKAYGDKGCATYNAFEEVLMRRDIDAVSIAVPDHSHALIAVQAARAKKDIYCEKPLAHNFREGLLMVEESQRLGRVWQTGSWQRSVPNFRQACELVRNGRIGKIKSIEVGLPSGFYSIKDPARELKVTDPPKTLFYDRWLGPAPEAPYCEARVHKQWRWNLDYGGGQLMDWIGHHVDIAHWGMDWDNNGPVEVEGVGEYPPRTDLYNAAKRFKVNCIYPDGTPMTIAGGYPEIAGGTKWFGEKGWIYVDRGKIDANPKSLLSEKIGENEVHLTNHSGAHDHYEQFVACVKSRGRTLTPASVALHSATPGWLGQIAMLTGRKIKWDPKNFQIADDAEATKLLSRKMRAPYSL